MGPGQTKGITNALTRIETTFLRMKADVDAGLRKQIPPGLLRVFEKFFGWLGQPVEFEETWESIEASRTPVPPDAVDVTPESELDLEPEVTVNPIALPGPASHPLAVYEHEDPAGRAPAGSSCVE